MLWFDVYVTMHHDKFLIIKPTRCTNFSNLFLEWNSTCSDSSSVHHQEFFTVHTAMVCVIQVCWQLASRIRLEHPDPVHKLSANLYDIPLLCVQWKTPDDGQRNCPKHAEFHSKNKFEKLVHLVGFIIRNSRSGTTCSATWTAGRWQIPNLSVHCHVIFTPSGKGVLWQSVGFSKTCFEHWSV